MNNEEEKKEYEEESIENDVTIEDLDNEGSEKNTVLKLKDIKEKLKAAEKEAKENLEGWQRAKADAINEKRRFEEDKKDLITFANKKLVLEFIPVMDSFLMAMKNKESWEAVDANWRIGVEYIKSQLESALKSGGVEVYGSIGEEAVPERYNSLETVATQDSLMDGKVAEILQYGYTLHGKVVREAKVKTYILEAK
jgi:molecular chaperone GrpE